MRIIFRCPPELQDILPRPVPAREGLPDWLRTMPGTVRVDLLDADVRTVKHCPPFLDAMQSGFLIPLACDVRIKEGTFSWDWKLPPTRRGRISRSPISFHHPEQALGSPIHVADQILIKFNAFWTIELEPGWSLLAVHPVNRHDLPFETLTGLVDADLYADGLIHYPARWRVPDFKGVLPAGTPLAQCFPVRREKLDLNYEALAGERAERFAEVKAAVAAEPGAYRKRWRAPRA